MLIVSSLSSSASWVGVRVKVPVALPVLLGNRDREVRHRRVVRARSCGAAADRLTVHVHVSVHRRVDVRRHRHRRGAVVLAHARHIRRQSYCRVPFKDPYPIGYVVHLVTGREAPDRETLIVIANGSPVSPLSLTPFDAEVWPAGIVIVKSATSVVVDALGRAVGVRDRRLSSRRPPMSSSRSVWP